MRCIEVYRGHHVQRAYKVYTNGLGQLDMLDMSRFHRSIAYIIDIFRKNRHTNTLQNDI